MPARCVAAGGGNSNKDGVSCILFQSTQNIDAYRFPKSVQGLSGVQTYGQVSSNEVTDISWKEVESFVNSSYEITDCIRSYVCKVLGLAQQNCSSGVEFVWSSVAVVVKTCLLLDLPTGNGQPRKAGEGRDPPQLLKEEAACISILALFSSVAATGSDDASLADACQWICCIAQDYLREKCKTEERFQQVTQLLQGDSTTTLISLPT